MPRLHANTHGAARPYTPTRYTHLVTVWTLSTFQCYSVQLGSQGPWQLRLTACATRVTWGSPQTLSCMAEVGRRSSRLHMSRTGVVGHTVHTPLASERARFWQPGVTYLLRIPDNTGGLYYRRGMSSIPYVLRAHTRRTRISNYCGTYMLASYRSPYTLRHPSPVKPDTHDYWSLPLGTGWCSV